MDSNKQRNKNLEKLNQTIPLNILNNIINNINDPINMDNFNKRIDNFTEKIYENIVKNVQVEFDEQVSLIKSNKSLTKKYKKELIERLKEEDSKNKRALKESLKTRIKAALKLDKSTECPYKELSAFYEKLKEDQDKTNSGTECEKEIDVKMKEYNKTLIQYCKVLQDLSYFKFKKEKEAILFDLRTQKKSKGQGIFVLREEIKQLMEELDGKIEENNRLNERCKEYVKKINGFHSEFSMKLEDDGNEE